MPRPDIWKAREEGNRSVLDTASLEEVAAAMFSLCDWCDSPPFVDFDKLMSIGMWVAHAGHESADETVVEWFAVNPTAHRLDIVQRAAVLHGSVRFRSARTKTLLAREQR
jgi:hypothetical protein